MITIGDLLASEIRIVNVGLESFAVQLETLGAAVIHVRWSPPAGGDVRRAVLIATLADEEDTDR